MQLWALIKDGFRESRDRRIFWVLLLMSVCVAVAMFCIRFEPDGIDIMFGMWKIDAAQFADSGVLRTDMIAAVIVDGIMDTALGSVGIILSIIATAGFLPHLLEKGSVEIVVSKPIARWKLFLGRYLGGVSFVLFHATVFVGLTFLVAGVRWGVWLPGYLFAIPLVTLLFSFLYCISALTAVVTRGTVTAVLVTLVAWAFFGAIQSTDDWLNSEENAANRPVMLKSLHLARQMVPKTQDVLYLAKRWSNAANAADLFPGAPEPEAQEMVNQARRAEDKRRKIPAYQTLGSSLLFELVILAVAMWRFSRMDF